MKNIIKHLYVMNHIPKNIYYDIEDMMEIENPIFYNSKLSYTFVKHRGIYNNNITKLKCENILLRLLEMVHVERKKY